jgi:peptidyl-tRNA hydrolase, PTH1 family
MYLVVGLRNPGPDYDGTRHNVGFEVIQAVLKRRGETLGRAPLKVNGRVAKIGSGDGRVFYFVSNRFMNETGGSVRAAAIYFKIQPDNILVVHDDIDLPFGRLRLQVGGGSGGHNGIRSIEKAAGTADFSRLKLGVGRPPGSMNPADYVLRQFAKSEQPDVDVMVEVAADVVELWSEDAARAQEMAARYGAD